MIYSVGDIVLLFGDLGYIDRIEGNLLYIHWFDYPQNKPLEYRIDIYAPSMKKIS
jgi:hypothetical protein